MRSQASDVDSWTRQKQGEVNRTENENRTEGREFCESEWGSMSVSMSEWVPRTFQIHLIFLAKLPPELWVVER